MGGDLNFKGQNVSSKTSNLSNKINRFIPLIILLHEKMHKISHFLLIYNNDTMMQLFLILFQDFSLFNKQKNQIQQNLKEIFVLKCLNY